MADERQQALRRWLQRACGIERFDLTVASADASFRRYFRVTPHDRVGPSLIAMDAPPEQEDSRPFVAVAHLFAGAGLNVPRISAMDLSSGFLLLSDLGRVEYLSRLQSSPDEADSLYRAAIDSLVMLQAASPEIAGRLPPYDAALLQRELDLFPDWFCARHCERPLDKAERRHWQDCCRWLIDEATGQPQVAVHRDYHSRNLMVCDSGAPGVIDFQDAVEGPLAYDLVSLLKDCYIVWPPERRAGWIDYYLARLDDVDGRSVDRGEFDCVFRRIGIQRHLKVAGIFSRLNYRDGKSRYLADLPVVFAYLLEALEQEPRLAFLHDYVADQCLNAL